MNKSFSIGKCRCFINEDFGRYNKDGEIVWISPDGNFAVLKIENHREGRDKDGVLIWVDAYFLLERNDNSYIGIIDEEEAEEEWDETDEIRGKAEHELNLDKEENEIEAEETRINFDGNLPDKCEDCGADIEWEYIAPEFDGGVGKLAGHCNCSSDEAGYFVDDMVGAKIKKVERRCPCCHFIIVNNRCPCTNLMF